MTKGEINLLYNELEKLLSDICQFLSEEITNGYMSQNGRSIANVLIERSKQQLQVITTVTSDCINEPYVDMQSYKGNSEHDEHQEVYSDVSLTFENDSNSTVMDDEYICPYATLPATEIKKGKCGNLYRKEKIFFFEQQKKFYAAVHQSWFLIYANENSLKPCQTYNLFRYEAKPSSMTIKDMKKRDESFELINTVDFKPLQFTALTAKDMLQWVAAINRESDRTISKRRLPPVPSPAKTPDESVIDASNVYEPLKEFQLKEDRNSDKLRTPTINKKGKQPLPLPPRNTVLPEIKSPPQRVPSEESLSSNYDSVGPATLNSLKHSNSSFSGDDSDTYYDNPLELKKQELIRSAPNNSIDDDEDEIYDYLQKPDTVIKSESTIPLSDSQKIHDKKIKSGKSKPSLRPKILSLKHIRKNNS